MSTDGVGRSVAGRSAALAELPGAWRRSLLAWPDGRRDTTTWVLWVQGPRLYVDLRQPAGGAGPQEGFAGELAVADGVFEWHRRLDLGPPGPYGDRGLLTVPGDGSAETLVEDGRDVSYVEHWQRVPGSTAGSAALQLTGSSGREGVLVRAGSYLAYAHGVPGDPGRPGDEIAIARPGGRGWVIERSSLAHRVGEPIVALLAGDRLRVGDDHWHVGGAEGDPGAFSVNV
jgi:hypothetical protein